MHDEAAFLQAMQEHPEDGALRRSLPTGWKSVVIPVEN